MLLTKKRYERMAEGETFALSELVSEVPVVSDLAEATQIIESLRTRLFTLPDHVQVHPGHGRSTTIGAERPQLPAWVERGW